MANCCELKCFQRESEASPQAIFYFALLFSKLSVENSKSPFLLKVQCIQDRLKKSIKSRINLKKLERCLERRQKEFLAKTLENTIGKPPYLLRATSSQTVWIERRRKRNVLTIIIITWTKIYYFANSWIFGESKVLIILMLA